MELLKESPVRFQISNQGWSRMNCGRSMGHLIREAISNILDLTDVTEAKLTIEDGHVIIEDNGTNGFSDVALISTVFLTDKEDSATKRGRKGRGLKELIAAATKATVETIGHTIQFEEGRKEYKNTRTQGTKVEIWTDLENWKNEHVKTCIEYLHKIIPPETIKLHINNQEIHKPEYHNKINTCLETVIITDGIQKNSYRFSDVKFHKASGKAWIYEIGIPIQEIPGKYHIDVQQRVPVNDNRDVVETYYKNSLLGCLLNIEVGNLTATEMNDEWVIIGLPYVSEESKKKYVEKFVGPKAVLKSTNDHCNDVAKQNGYNVVDPTKMAFSVQEVIKVNVETVDSIVAKIESTAIEKVEPDSTQKRFANLMKFIAEKVVEHSINVKFFRQPKPSMGKHTIASYGVKLAREGDLSSLEGNLSYNVHESLVTENIFHDPLNVKNIETLCHELGHEWSTNHEENFIVGLEKATARICHVFIKHLPEILLLSKAKLIQGKTTTITCIDCSVLREVKTQDIKQAQRCLLCQRKHRNFQKKVRGIK